ncbi:MAG: hypothetical protein OXR68_01335 [Alphaproteobacteria bacterium]|nr:hypothetical protein [Alphaproteobacteria bacterium]MDD9919254.1 hypothetical protein [Alphaproteobacteria bacterium]
MNNGRLIIVLDTKHCLESRQALHDFWQDIQPGDKPTFAIGLINDVTLALTSRYPNHIYNAFEYISLTDESIWFMLSVNEVYIVINGKIWPSKSQLGLPQTPTEPATLLPKTDDLRELT